MILSKQVGVYLNQVHCLIKQCFVKQFTAKGIDLTPEQYLVMDLLWDEGPLTQQSIADFIEKDKNSVTKFINNLEKKGLLYREHDPRDRRQNYIELTPLGRRLKRKVTRTALYTANTLFGNIETQELEAFVAVLRKMGTNMKKFLDK